MSVSETYYKMSVKLQLGYHFLIETLELDVAYYFEVKILY